MAVPKTAALPLGDAPTRAFLHGSDGARNRAENASVRRLPPLGAESIKRPAADGRRSKPTRGFGGERAVRKSRRSIAQPGSAPASGAGGRVFESHYSDQSNPGLARGRGFCCTVARDALTCGLERRRSAARMELPRQASLSYWPWPWFGNIQVRVERRPQSGPPGTVSRYLRAPNWKLIGCSPTRKTLE